MPETVQTLFLFLVMGGAALAVGWRLGKSQQSEPDPTPPAEASPESPAQAPADEKMSAEDDPKEVEGGDRDKNEDESKKEPEKPKDIIAIAEGLGEELGRSPSPQSFLDSEAFQKGLAAVDHLNLSAEHLLGFVRNDSEIVAALAMRAQKPDDFDLPRLRTRLIDALQAGSLLVRTVALQTLEHCALPEDRLIGSVVARLDFDWENPPSRELLEAFLRRRLELELESLQVARALEKVDPWDLSGIEDVVNGLPHDLRKPLIESIEKARHKAVDFKEFLQGFGTILPPVVTQVEDGSPLVATSGLDAAADQVAANLLRSDHARPVLLSGRQGVGKSALTMLVAKRLQDKGYLVFRAASTDLQSGQCYIGQLEERVRQFVDILRKHKILWIAESFHELGLAGRHKFSQSSILDMILPHLHSGAIRVLGEIRPAALDRLAQQVPRLDTAMEIMRVPELPPAETLALAAQWIDAHPGRNGCKPVSNKDALAEGLRLCEQYLNAHYRPGKLLDLLKMTFSRLADQHPNRREASLHPPAFLAALAAISGMPLEIIDDSRQLDLDALRQLFDKRVMGQPEAVEALVERVAMLKSGLTDPTRPLGVFLFAGPTGTGKTEIAKTLARFLFGSPDRMIRLDMSEFQNPSSISRITGGPEEAQSLASRIRQQPFSLVLLDEFEKADHHVWDLFLQVFDDGRLTDQQGNTADLRNAIIILTSNLGAASAQGTPLGFSQNREPGYQPDEVRKAIEKTFRKEFVNRLDRIVCFRPLSRETMREILHHQLALVLERRGLRQRPWQIEWDHSATEFLLDRGFTATMGARPLQRAVERFLLAPLAESIVRGDLGDDEQLLFIYARDGRLRWDSSLDPIADTGERESDSEAEIKPLSNRKLILHPAGNEQELRYLIRRHEVIADLLELDAYRERKEECLQAMSQPGFWDGPARFRTLGLAEYIERVESSLRSTGEFLRRLLADPPRRGSPERFRSLVSHNAERLYLLEHAYAEITGEDGWDAFLSVRPGDGSSASHAFAVKLGEMYDAWARQRGMRIESLQLQSPHGPAPAWAAAIEGFGAWHILRNEAGNHLNTEGGRGDTATAEVRVVPQPPEPPDFLGLSPTALADREFAQYPPPLQTVRRYQDVPTPLVRDKSSNWRTGRLDLVMRGHFDIIGC